MEVGKKWTNSLVGYFIGRKPYFVNIRENLLKKWKIKGDLQVFTLNKGNLFQFSCGEDSNYVLESCDHSYGGRPLILRKWSPDTPLEKLNLTSVPIWIRLPGLPLQFWSANGISKIASYIGNPLYMDSKTAESTRLSYARCCIEVEAGTPYPEVIPIHTTKGVHNQEVQYDWKPSACKQCNNFSHSTEACPKNILQVREPKSTQVWRQVTRDLKGPPKVTESDNKDKNPEEEAQILLDSSSSAPAVQNELSKGSSSVKSLILSPSIKVQNSYMALANLNDTERGESTANDAGQNQEIPLVFFSGDFFCCQQPWIALGDFNITRFADKRWGGADPNISDMNEFNDCIEDCSLLDLRSVGQILSWNNRSRTGNLKLRRLDRALVNEEWLQVFPTSYVHYKNPGLSDHAPIIVPTSPVHNTGGKPFKFHNMWLSDTSLYEVVERAWNMKIRGNPMFKIFKKLQGTKRAIKDWNRNSFGRVDILSPQIRKTLDEIQTKVAVDPRNIRLRAEENIIQEKFNRIAKQEESLFHQKSRVNWLNLGDSNTEFFHSAMSMRRNQNQIQGIEDQNGEICTEPQGIADILVNHFSCLLNHNIPMIGDLPEPKHKLSSADAQDLIKLFSAEEIKEVVFKCDGNRAPGPDGFNGAFFKHFWYLIGEEVTEAIQYFFRSGNLLPAFNTTFIALIPKCSGTSSLTNSDPSPCATSSIKSQPSLWLID
ncbi:uncharacterized protein LOC143865141 [Tasmannia lanceolata]|uniref:uncharacterized protein LOC143865141 n=1 Tax=Tasmannia lanceolata TaxID=3420 RepID=UPI00406317D5